MNRRALIGAGSALAAAGALAGSFVRRPGTPSTWRVGHDSFPPYLIVGEKGEPDGFAVAAFSEAARRRGIRIEWVNTQGSPDNAFATGASDVYPMLALTEERRQRLAPLVLMDVQMPEVDGLEATRLIRAQESSAHLPIIALTASAVPEQRAACDAAGMNGVPTKPCGLEELRGEILRWVPAEVRRDPSTAA